jgi:Ca2+-binding RTX toxin-like protein
MRMGSVIRWQWALLGALGMACGGPAPDAEDPSNPATNNGGAAGNSASHAGSGGAGSRSGNSPGGGGAGPVEGPGTDPTVLLPGVDQPLDTPPPGCVRAARNGALQLELTEQVPSVELRGAAGVLQANGKACSDADGVELRLIDLSSLQITGGPEQNAVVLDLGSGDWSTLLGFTPESVTLALGEGENGLLIRGGSGNDNYRHAMRSGELVLDLIGDGNIQLVASGVTELGFALGDGDDRLEDLAEIVAAADPLADLELAALTLPVSISGGPGHDVLVGGSNDDVFDGGTGNDVMSGLDGSDHFQADVDGDGADIWNGGPGYDQLSYELRSEDLELNACVSTSLIGCSGEDCLCEDSGATDEGDLIVNVEDLKSGGGDDILRGSEVSDSLRGGAGNDSLFGLGGSDLLAGERGVDQLEGGTDGDICDGQPGEAMTGCEL